MKCPRCQSPIASSPDPSGALVCPSCGARLRSKASAPRARAAVEASAKDAEAARPGKPSAAAVLENPNATLPPGTPLRPIPKAGTTAIEALVDSPAGKPPAAPRADPAEPAISLEMVMEEVRALRRTQDEILALLRERPERGGASETEDPFGFGMDTPASVPAAAPVRSRRRKSVLLMDDDAATRQAAVTALERAEVPVRAVGDGNSGLQALAEERCDVLILELGMGGAMAGKDVVNVIKATMEWVDIPIVLYTRVPVQGQKEARQIHGADELVPKAKGSEETLVSRVIQLFRRP
jgi:CheY-like chemotaxis protein